MEMEKEDGEGRQQKQKRAAAGDRNAQSEAGWTRPGRHRIRLALRRPPWGGRGGARRLLTGRRQRLQVPCTADTAAEVGNLRLASLLGLADDSL